MTRIGILGGTFNPVHNGHLLMAELARDKMNLDLVIFMPAACSPHKLNQSMADGKDRYAMVKSAIKSNPRFTVSRMELDRGGPSYTVDTLKALRGEHPKAKLFWIIGDDNCAGLETWKDFHTVIQLAAFIVISRNWFNISSTDIRERVKRGRSIQYLTPDTVIRYIKQRRLYV